MKMLWQTLQKTKVKINNQVSHLITEIYQVNQAWFLLHKFMLIIHNQLLVLHTFENGFWDCIFHQFSDGRYNTLYQEIQDTLKDKRYITTWKLLGKWKNVFTKTEKCKDTIVSSFLVPLVAERLTNKFESKAQKVNLGSPWLDLVWMELLQAQET